MSEKSKTARGQCVGEKSTGSVIHINVIRNNANIFETSRKNKTQYFVDVVKDKRRTKNNNLEFLIIESGGVAFPFTTRGNLELICQVQNT